MAQAGHAAQLGWRAATRRQRKAWADHDFALSVRTASADGWRRALELNIPVVQDGGFTEVEPGTRPQRSCSAEGVYYYFFSSRERSSRCGYLTKLSYSSTVRWAMAAQPNSDTARSRPALPMACARAGSPQIALTASAMTCLELLGRHRQERHQRPGQAVRDDLGDAADRGGHDRGLAGHRLEVHDALRLVHGRADEHGRMREQRDDLVARQHLLDPDDAAARRAERLDGGGGLRARSRRCPARRRTARAGSPGRTSRPRRAGAPTPFCRVIRPTKMTYGRDAVDAEPVEDARRRDPARTSRCRCRCG